VTTLLRRLLSALRALLRRRRLHEELDAELDAYLEADVDARMRAGASRSDALREARIRMGSRAAVTERVRDVGWEARVEDLFQDVRHACRLLRRSPGLSAVAVLTLAIGIGANTAVFSVVNALLLRALPVAEPHRLVVLSTRSAVEQGFPGGWTYPLWEQILHRGDAVDGALAWTVFPQPLDLAQGGEIEAADGLFVSGAFFQALGVQPVRGRAFRDEEDVLGAPESRVAVLSYGFWQRRFGGRDVVGERVTVNRVPVTVVGVAPPEFLGPEVGRAFEIALPLGAAPSVLHDASWGTREGLSYLAVMLRLRPGQSIDGATALLRGLHRALVEGAMRPGEAWGDYQDAQLGDPIVLVPASAGTSELRRGFARAIVTVLIIAGVVLLIACVNIANLLLARATARRRELGTRLALGATRWRLGRQLILESLVLSTLGATAGLVLSGWVSRAMVAQLSTWSDRIVLDVAPDWRVLAFTVATVVATTLVFGAAPALRSSRLEPAIAMRRATASTAYGGAVSGVRAGLIAPQVALSLVLLVAAALFLRSFGELAREPLGFESDPVLVARIDASRAPVPPADRAVFYERLAQAVGQVPGVAQAAVSLNTPFNRGVTLVADFLVAGSPPRPEGERRATVNYVSPGWFEAYGMPIRAGRAIDQRDTAASSPVAIANEAFVRAFLAGRDPIGAQIDDALSLQGAPLLSKTIVGVVDGAADQSQRREPAPTLYLPLLQWTQHPMAGSGFMQLSEISLSVRATSGSPDRIGPAISATLADADPALAFSLQPLNVQVGAARQQERLIAILSATFGALAVLLAAIGVYGVTAYGVERRRAEIGIRMALGAGHRHVVSMEMRRTLTAVLVGLTAGLVAAALLTSYLEALLFGVTPLDAVAFGSAAAILVAAASLASLLPARRAARVDPMIVLRAE
jgi:predicted permease